MATYTPVDNDPFAPTGQARLEPVDYDPFAGKDVTATPNEKGQIPPETGAIPRADAPTIAPVPNQGDSAPPSHPAIDSFMSDIAASGVRGWHSFQRGRYLTQHVVGSRSDALENFLNEVEQSDRINQEYPSSPTMQKAQEELSKQANSGGGGFLPSLGVYAQNPRLSLGTFVESAPSMIPSAATTPLGVIAGGLAGGPPGAVLGAKVGAGIGSAMGDFGSAFEDFVRDNYKPKTRDEWRAVMLDPDKYKKALDYAMIHSGTVGAFDAVGMGVGSRVGSKIVGDRVGGAVARPLAIGVAGAPASSAVGAAGEAAGEYLGAGKIDPTQVAGEFVGGLVGDVATTAVEPIIHGTDVGGVKNTPITPEGIDTATQAMQPQVPTMEQPAPEAVSGSMSVTDSPVFYSPVRQTVEEKGPNVASPEQWLATLKNTPGVKQEEIDDLGVGPFLSGRDGKVTKREFLDFLDENAIRVEETHRVEEPEDLSGTNGWTSVGTSGARYGQYTLPGPRSGYTELTLHVPTRNIEGDNTQRDFVGGHYPEPNVIAHVRVTEREDTNGNPVAFIEEIQSDWHQAGRKAGYTTELHRQAIGQLRERETAAQMNYRQLVRQEQELDVAGKPIPRELADQIMQADNEWQAATADYNAAIRDTQGPPEGPFKSSWNELAFKRMLRWAADKGYRTISWTNAAEQARRYPGSETRNEGMRQFYDKIVPSIARKWAKRLGGQLTTTSFESNQNNVSVKPTGGGTFVLVDPNGNRLPGTHTHTNINAALDEAQSMTAAASKLQLQAITLPQAAIDLIQRGLPMYSELGDMPATKAIQVQEGAQGDKYSAKAARAKNLNAKFAPALMDIMKGFKFKKPVNIYFQPGRSVSWRQGKQTVRYNVLGMMVTWPNHYDIRIAVDQHATDEAVWATLVHEMGHVVEAELYHTAPKGTRVAIQAAYDEWRGKIGETANMQQLLATRDNAIIAYQNGRRFAPGSRLEDQSPEKRRYWVSFEEWFAEQVARWATTNIKPLSTVEKFFKGVGDTIIDILEKAARKFGFEFEPVAAMNDWLNSFHTQAAPFGEEVKITTDVETIIDNEKHMGPDEPAVEQQPETGIARDLVGKVFEGRPPKEVQETLAYADKFNKIYKWGLGIHQVAQRNPHIDPLQKYTEMIAVAQLTKQQIMIRAQEVLKAWNRLGGTQADAVSALIDDVQNLVYLTPDEIKNKVTRFPTQQELAALAQKHGVSQQGLNVFSQVALTFQEHLTRYEAVLRSEAEKIADAKEKMDRLDAITLQIRALRSRPYFPAMRFGDYTITVRNAGGQVIHFETFEKERTRNKAAEAMKGQIAVDDAMQLGKLDRAARPLLGVPTTLLDMMAEKLKMSPAQRDALDQLKFELSPAQSFKHRFQHKRRIAGYSQDFRRAYANYFFHGANHLMKTKYADELRGLAKATKAEVDNVYQATKRHEIVAYMNDHLENWLDPKSDWASIRSIAFFYSLAFSPAAAAQNLTQTLMTTYPFLAQQFGDVSAVRTLMRVGADFQTFYKKGTLQNATDFDLRALAQGIQDGIISEAMAPELAGFAEGRTLGLGFGNNALQTGLNKINEAGAKMFEMAEQVNRRLAFRAALRLAKENPGAKYVVDMRKKHQLHYEQLRNKGWTEAEASAYVVARDVTITTQFQYGREYAPRFMRGKLRSIFVFKTFIQNYVLFLANYPQAAARSLLIMGFLGGLMGTPGADDLKEILKAIGWKMFGKDFDLEKEARRLIIQMVGQDENGRQVADQVLHGVARKGFGIPAFMDMLGGTVGVDIPMPTFDRSASISAGTILPVELGKLFGPPTQDQDSVIAAQAQKASGAVFGVGFNVYKTLTNAKTDWGDSKRWERAVPRFIGNIAKAYRVGTEGRERTNTGSTLVNYDVRDTEQLMEVIGMAAGYTPYRQSLQWNRVMAGQDAVKLMEIRQQGLMKQYFNAAQGKDVKEIDRVRDAIRTYNQELPQEAKGFAITADNLRQSMQARARTKAAQEAESSVHKRDIPVLRKVQELYPDSQATTVRKVRGTP